MGFVRRIRDVLVRQPRGLTNILLNVIWEWLRLEVPTRARTRPFWTRRRPEREGVQTRDDECNNSAARDGHSNIDSKNGKSHCRFQSLSAREIRYLDACLGNTIHGVVRYLYTPEKKRHAPQQVANGTGALQWLPWMCTATGQSIRYGELRYSQSEVVHLVGLSK